MERFHPHIPTREEVQIALANVSFLKFDLDQEIAEYAQDATIIEFPAPKDYPEIAA